MGRITDFDSTFSKIITFLFPKNCFEELFIHFNFLHPECTSLVLSRFLGIGIILGSVMVKVPQIVKIYRARSGEGVSFLSQAIELLCATVAGAYSFAKFFPFSAWGEAVFMAAQTAMVCFMIRFYAGRKSAALMFLILYLMSVAACGLRLVPINVLATLQVVNIPIGVTGRLWQVYGNYQSGSTGQLSLLTVFMMFAGCLARVFTSVKETGDQLLIVPFILASITNGIILAQIFWYWGQTPKQKLL